LINLCSILFHLGRSTFDRRSSKCERRSSKCDRRSSKCVGVASRRHRLLWESERSLFRKPQKQGVDA
ncbi:hypothetical protein, partial [uncultured Nostoc sp.]|uniref:hypothetical protein n=1 Tax=uncultured Nostoc sp. TaxID=340711 RepID=UPI00261EC9D5